MISNFQVIIEVVVRLIKEYVPPKTEAMGIVASSDNLF